MFFRHDKLLGTLNLTDAELFELYVENAATQVDIQLNQAHIKRAISILNSSVHLQAGLLYAEGDTTFENVVPIGSVNLRHSHFQSLTIKGFDEWLRRSATGGFDLEGLSFDYIEIADAQVVPHAKSMLDLFDRIPYSPQPYVELEKFLRSHGEPETADETYIRMRHKERSRLSLWRKPFDWFLWISIGYGRKPWRAGIGALALIVLGTFVFRREKMTQEEKSSDNWYRSYWFSLDLLSPIDLGVSKKWRPSDDRLRAYAQIHRVRLGAHPAYCCGDHRTHQVSAKFPFNPTFSPSAANSPQFLSLR